MTGTTTTKPTGTTNTTGSRVNPDLVKPHVYIMPRADAKIWHWVRMATGEVSGLGLVDVIDGQMVVSDVFLPKQECTSADTDLDQQAVAQLMMELDNEGVDLGKLRFWWHSHADMEVFWSGTDTGTMQELSGGDTFLLSMVVNKKHDRKLRVDMFNPFNMILDNLGASVLDLSDEELKEECKKAFDENVSEGYSGYYSGSTHNRSGGRSSTNATHSVTSATRRKIGFQAGKTPTSQISVWNSKDGVWEDHYTYAEGEPKIVTSSGSVVGVGAYLSKEAEAIAELAHEEGWGSCIEQRGDEDANEVAPIEPEEPTDEDEEITYKKVDDITDLVCDACGNYVLALDPEDMITMEGPKGTNPLKRQDITLYCADCGEAHHVNVLMKYVDGEWIPKQWVEGIHVEA